MAPPASLFVDTSALFSGLWSSQGGARALLQLGELQRVRLLVSPEVMDEMERVLRRKAPDLLADITLVLDRARVEVVASGCAEEIEACTKWTRHLGDAHILAAARRAKADYLVTLDREHLLANRAVIEHGGIPIGTPGDALLWLRTLWTA